MDPLLADFSQKEKSMADKVKDPIDKGMIRVMVYGTLKYGHSNHRLLEQADAIFMGYDSVTGPYQMYDLGAIPAVLDSTKTGNRKIRGELYAVNPEGLAAMDLLEGHPHFYARRKLRTDVMDRNAWMYMLVAPNFVHDNADPKDAGIWHGSAEENKFWLDYNKKKSA